MALIPHEFIYRNDLAAIGDFHSQCFVDCLADGDIVAVYFRAQGVTDFTDDWFFGLKVNGADVLTGGDRPQITSGNLAPETEGLSIPVSFEDRFSPTVDERATGIINGPIRVIVVVDDGITPGYTDEEAQDAVGGILVDSATIDFTYNDGVPSVTADVKDDSITFDKLLNASAHSKLVGRRSGSTGNFEEITLGTNLSMSGTTLNATGGGGGSGAFELDDGDSVADGVFEFDEGDSA